MHFKAKLNVNMFYFLYSSFFYHHVTKTMHLQSSLNKKFKDLSRTLTVFFKDAIPQK